MVEFILNTIFWILALYGLLEIIKNVIYICTYTKFKSDGIYLIIAVKNQEEKIEYFLRSLIFKIVYGKEEILKNIIVADLKSTDGTKEIVKKMAEENEKNRKFPISFNPQEWENYVGASCYLYALNIFKDEYILVGDMIGKRCEHEVSDETLIKVLKEELEYIGYELKEIDKECVISNNKYKICLMRDPRTGFYHFLREESDGNWTHKQPGELPQVFQMNKINNSDLLQSEPFRKRWYFEIGGKSYE